MSKYTTEVRFICEMNSGFPTDEMTNHTPDEIITASRAKIFDFSYPIYESGHKAELETKILKHYYTREIGAETVGLWKLWLNEKLNLIMPKYNKLYKAEQSILDKELKNIDVHSDTLRTDDLLKEDDYTRTDNLQDAHDSTRTDNLQDAHDSTRTDNLQDAHDSTRTDNLQDAHDSTRTDNLQDAHDTTRTDNLQDETDMTRTDNLTRNSVDRYSDTPQGTVANVDYNTYLTDYRHITDTNTGTQKNAGTVDHTGTQRDAGTVNHTGTQRDAGTVDHTGTQRDAGTVDHTGTQRDAGTVDHTGTQRDAGTVDHTGTQRNEGRSANTGTQEIESDEFGYRGERMYAELLETYYQKILNIDMLIVYELSDLFMKLW